MFRRLVGRQAIYWVYTEVLEDFLWSLGPGSFHGRKEGVAKGRRWRR